MDEEATDRRWLDAAARLASAALGTVSGGPLVGALIVDPQVNRVVARAISVPRAIEHAELVALREAGDAARGKTLYTTFEPPAHFGNLGPLTEPLIAAGIGRVVAGFLDPDPERSGQGLAALVEGGVPALHLQHAPSEKLNEGYATRATKRRPFVTLKITVSSDGMVGHARRGEPLPIGIESLRFLERERAASDAVLSGIARADIEDNDLRVHLAGLSDRAALRVILTGNRPIDIEMSLFTAKTDAPVLLVTTPDRPLRFGRNIRVIEVDGRRGHPDLRRVLSLLAEGGINRLFVESGARLAESFISAELIDRLLVIDASSRVGSFGVPAALLGRFNDRITAARYVEVDRRPLGEDKVRTFERR